MVQDFTERAVLSSSGIRSSRDCARIEEHLSTLEGVRDVHVDPDAHTVEVAHDPTLISALAIQGQLKGLGYTIESVDKKAPLLL